MPGKRRGSTHRGSRHSVKVAMTSEKQRVLSLRVVQEKPYQPHPSNPEGFWKRFDQVLAGKKDRPPRGTPYETLRCVGCGNKFYDDTPIKEAYKFELGCPHCGRSWYEGTN